MTRKFNFIPYIPSYEFIRKEMEADLMYRLKDRKNKTSLGRPLYFRINVQLIMTLECPYNCPFCIERKNPMKGCFDANKQLESLHKVLLEHPSARLTITGGEPSLYPSHLKEIINLFKEKSNNTFCSINTAGYDTSINYLAHINLSVNDYVHPNPNDYPGCTYQTVLSDDKMNINTIKYIMNNQDTDSFSFRFLTIMDKHDYNVEIWNQLQNDSEVNISTFRIGDFFVYATFDYNGKHARITLGDMYQQQQNDYKDGYSNIIIHPDGRITTNWK